MNKRIIEKIIKTKDEYDNLAVATIVDAKSSSPRDTGTSMLIFPDGKTYSTIGGGSQEKDIINKALKLLKKGKSGRISFNLTRKEAAQIGWVCGGDIDVYIENVWL
ncbi:MAG: XdhC family protein [Halanaerobiales bacterium]|nr:XdhC family protein [Halanaerobiales bacterium]